MEKASDLKDLNSFKQLKLMESAPYFYNAWSKLETSHNKEALASLIADPPTYNVVMVCQTIDSITKKDINESDFNKIAKALQLKTNDLARMYDKLLQRNKLNSESSSSKVDSKNEKWGKVFDKIDLDKSGEITMQEMLKYFQLKKIDISNIPRKDLSEAFTRMDSDRNKNISKDEFINFCISKKNRAFNEAVNKIAELEGLNKKNEISAEEQAALVEKEIQNMNLTPEKIDQYTKCFNLMDTAKDGNITKNNFVTFLHLRRLEKFFTSDEIAQIFRDMEGDTENLNYQVDKAEFFRYLSGANVNKKFISFLDTVFVNFIQTVIKIIESDEDFKARLKLDDDVYSRYAAIYDLFDVDNTGQLKFKNLIPLLKKNGIDITTPEGNKIFKEMNKEDDDSVTKNQFIEYVTNKANSAFRNNMDELATKEGGIESIKKKLQLRKSTARKSVDLSKSLSLNRVSSLSGNEVTLKIDAFINAVDNLKTKSFTKPQLEDYLKNKKLVSLFSKSDTQALFKEGGDKIKRDFGIKYYNKNKNFKNLVDYIYQNIMESGTLTPKTPLLMETGSSMDLDQSINYEQNSEAGSIIIDDKNEEGAKKSGKIKGAMRFSTDKMNESIPLSTDPDETEFTEREGEEGEADNTIELSYDENDQQGDSKRVGRQRDGKLFESIKEDSPPDDKYINQLIDENNELRAKLDYYEQEKLGMMENQASLETALKEAEDSLSKTNAQMNETLQTIDLLNQNNEALHEQLKKVSENHQENIGIVKNFSKETEQLNQKIHELEDELAKSQSIRNELKAGLENQKQGLENELNDMKAKNNELLSKLDLINKSKTESETLAKTSLESKDQEISNFKSKNNELLKELEELKQKINVKSAEEEQTNRKLAELSKDSKKAMELSKTLDEKSTQESKLKDDLKNLEKFKIESSLKLEQANKTIDVLNTEKDSLKNHLDLLEKEKFQLNSQIQKLGNLETDLLDFKKKNSDFQNLENGLRDEVSRQSKLIDELQVQEKERVKQSDSLKLECTDLAKKVADLELIIENQSAEIKKLNEKNQEMQNELNKGEQKKEEDQNNLKAKLDQYESLKNQHEASLKKMANENDLLNQQNQSFINTLKTKEENSKLKDIEINKLRQDLLSRERENEERLRLKDKEIEDALHNLNRSEQILHEKEKESKDLNELVKKLSDQCINAKEINSLLEQNSSNRNEELVNENLKLKDLVQNNEKMIQNYQKNEKELRDKLLMLENSIYSKNEEQKRIQAELSKLEYQLNSKSKDSKDNEEKNDHLKKSLEEEIGKLQDLYKKELQNKEKLENECKDFNEKLSTLNFENKKLTEQVTKTEHEQKIAAIEKENEISKLKDDLKNKIDHSNKDSEKYLAEKDSLSKQIENLKKERDQIYQSLNEKNKMFLDSQKINQQLEEKLRKSESQISMSNQELSELREKNRDLEAKSQEMELDQNPNEHDEKNKRSNSNAQKRIQRTGDNQEQNQSDGEHDKQDLSTVLTEDTNVIESSDSSKKLVSSENRDIENSDLNDKLKEETVDDRLDNEDLGEVEIPENLKKAVKQHTDNLQKEMYDKDETINKLSQELSELKGLIDQLFRDSSKKPVKIAYRVR